MKKKIAPDLLHGWREAKKSASEVKTYENAVALQKAKRLFEDYRKSLLKKV